MIDGIHMTATLVCGGLTAFFVLATALSFARISHGSVRIFSFPRLQVTALTAILALPTFWFVEAPFWRWTFLLGQLGVVVVQLVTIARFTPVWKTQSPRYEGGPDDPNTVGILSYNVKMSNREYGKAIALTREVDPDIAVFMEPDEPWAKALEPLHPGYRHIISHPLSDAYGMILLSKLDLADTTLEYLLMDGVPSIRTTVTLPDGQRFRFYAVHPEPPVPNADAAGRDAELLKVADLVKAETLPCIVSGDLNDVAWSHTTWLFQRLSRLLDPRVGRGFYNTFDARYPFIRWPLDHLFHDARFALVDMRRLPHIGSDHFPMYFKLALTGSADGADLPEESDAEDRKEARELKKEGEALDRDAIGTDWEN